MRLDQLEFGLAHPSPRSNRDARRLPSAADRRDEILERFEEMDVRIPQRVVGIEDQIQRRLVAPGGWN